MKQDNVTSAKKLKDSSIQLTITDPIDGSTMKKRYTAIRGGISWPTADNPAYFCLVGQEYEPPGDWMLIAEHEADSLSTHSFYERVCDISEQMLCRSFYADLPDDVSERGFANDLSDCADERGCTLYVDQADSREDFFVLGLSRIRSAIDQGKLFLPDDSLVHAQLRSITRDDLAGSPEKTFHAIAALAHVIGSYHRYKPSLIARREPPPPVDWRVA